MVSFFLPTASLFDKIKITPIFEARERFNRRVNSQFSSKSNSNSSLFEQRYRIGGFATDGRWDAKLIYQNANDMDWTAKRNYSYQASDLYVGDVDYRADGGTATLGRQIIQEGGLRLFEESFFGQRSKSYDALRFTNPQWDAFAGRIAYSPNPADQALVAGGYTSRFGQTLIIFKHDQWVSHEDFYTGDQRYYFIKGQGRTKVEGEFEGAAQRGRYNGQDLDSWFLHARVGHGMGKTWEPIWRQTPIVEETTVTQIMDLTPCMAIPTTSTAAWTSSAPGTSTISRRPRLGKHLEEWSGSFLTDSGSAIPATGYTAPVKACCLFRAENSSALVEPAVATSGRKRTF